MAIVHPIKVAELCQQRQAVLVDIRSPAAWGQGIPVEARMMSSDELLAQHHQLLSQYTDIFILCYTGQKSQQMAIQFGSTCHSVEGGFKAWQSQGLPTEVPEIDQYMFRYERQIKLAGFGVTAQNKLTRAHVLVVGAGGLGAPALLYLAGSGVGKISLVDDDTVALHNLHRQIIYQEKDLNNSKALAAQQHLQGLNSAIQVNANQQRLTAENAEALMADVDLVIDGSDNVDTRQVINRFSLKLKTPWLYAAVTGFSIQLGFFSGQSNQACYQCIFPGLNDRVVSDCNADGVLAPVPGLAGLLQVTEAIKFLTGLGDGLQHKLLTYDVLNHHFKVLKYPPDINPNCALSHGN